MSFFTRLFTALGLILAPQTVPVVNAQATLPVEVDATPDHPAGFGYKTNWLAIRTNNPTAVLRALQLTRIRPANWHSGLSASNQKRTVFVTPSIHGWVLVVGRYLPYPYIAARLHIQDQNKFEMLFNHLAQQFVDVQFFGTYRVVGFDAWARARHGKIVRLFGFMDEVFANIGPQTAEERKLGFLDLGQRTPQEATDYLFRQQQAQEKQGVPVGQRHALPNETDTTNLAGLWSIDPTQIEALSLPLSLGFVGELPEQFSHSD